MKKWIQNLIGDLKPGEGLNVFLLSMNLFIAMSGYYIIKTVREPLILESGGAAVKTYSSAAQAIVIAFLFIPAYAWVSKRVDRIRLNYGLILFFIFSTELFWVLAKFSVPNLGIFFFIWVGLFSLSIVSQFWSYSNDLFSKEAGERLFPIIAIGATLGSPIGSLVAAQLFKMKIDPYSMLHLTAGMLVVHAILYKIIHGRIGQRIEQKEPKEEKEKIESENGFLLVLKNRYLGLIAVMLILLNLVNTTGEYILSSYVVEAAAIASQGAPDLSVATKAFVGAFYGDFFFVVNIVTFLVQVFLVSKLVKYLGLGGVLFLLPLIALGTYGLVFLGVGFTVFRVGKTAENSADYSAMNTAKAMLWLPTTKKEKYVAKQVIDTFFVRFGDVLSAVFVYLGTKVFTWEVSFFGLANVIFIVGWIFIAWRVYVGYQKGGNFEET